MPACGLSSFRCRLIEITARQRQTQRTLLDWLRVECAIPQPSNKLLAVTDLDSDAWVGEVKRIREQEPAADRHRVHALRNEYTRSIAPFRALAADLATEAHGGRICKMHDA